MTSGFDPDLLAQAVTLAQESESPWPRSMYYDDGSYVGNVEWNETGPWTEIVGPVKPRGGPAGLILRGGEEIARWGDVERADMTFSIAKSYLSTLAGVAHGDGLLPDLDEPVCTRVPGPAFEGPHNGQITWRHLLNMNSEWSGELFGKADQVDHYRQIGVGADNSRKGEMREMKTPGTFYEYNDVRVNALSFALMSLFRRPLPEVLRERIMDPIGASPDWRWEGYETSWVEIDGRRMQSVPGGGHAPDLDRPGSRRGRGATLGGRRPRPEGAGGHRPRALSRTGPVEGSGPARLRAPPRFPRPAPIASARRAPCSRPGVAAGHRPRAMPPSRPMVPHPPGAAEKGTRCGLCPNP